jgi:NAD(P)H dehydrogenase (quinone)
LNNSLAAVVRTPAVSILSFRRYAAQPANRRTLGNWVREFAQFMLAPLSPRFNFDRYDRELRRPLPSEPQLAPESTFWRREHAIATS